MMWHRSGSVRRSGEVSAQKAGAEFEGDLLRMRTREGMAVARAKGKLRGGDVG